MTEVRKGRFTLNIGRIDTRIKHRFRPANITPVTEISAGVKARDFDSSPVRDSSPGQEVGRVQRSGST